MDGFDIDKLFAGSLERLRTEAEYFSRLTHHKPELGRLNETHLFKLLRGYLPPKIGIGTGFIACSGNSPQQSPQCDIVLYDALNNAPLYQSDAWSIFPIEMVYGVIEVKTTINKTELNNAFNICAKIRKMAKSDPSGHNKSYLRQEQVSPKTPARFIEFRDRLPPRFFIFGYGGWKKAETLERNFKEASQAHQGAHIHGVCQLHRSGSFFVQHRAFKDGDERLAPVNKNGFRHFLISLPTTLDSMLPVDRNGLGFDLVNMHRYTSR